jgi:hypothetical protein
MPGDFPDWLLRQTAADFKILGKALHGVESDLEGISPWRLTLNLSAARRALHRVAQDLRYAQEFSDGAVRPRKGRRR